MKRLQQLIKKINKQIQNKGIINVLELKPLFNAYSGKDWKKHLKLNNNKPENKVLFQNEQIKLVLIYWDCFKKSKKHGHPEGGGLMKLLAGNLIETRFDPENTNTVIGKHHYSAENIAYIHDRVAYHVVENPSNEPAVSLHVYSPGIYSSMVIEDKATKAIEFKLNTAA